MQHNSLFGSLKVLGKKLHSFAVHDGSWAAEVGMKSVASKDKLRWLSGVSETITWTAKVPKTTAFISRYKVFGLKANILWHFGKLFGYIS